MCMVTCGKKICFKLHSLLLCHNPLIEGYKNNYNKLKYEPNYQSDPVTKPGSRNGFCGLILRPSPSSSILYLTLLCRRNSPPLHPLIKI